MTYTVAQLVAIGGQEWQKGSKHRVYFHNLGVWYGVRTERYNTGNIASATLDGHRISNTKARALLVYLDDARVYYDVAEGRFYAGGLDDTRDFHHIRSTILDAIKAAASAAQPEEEPTMQSQTTTAQLPTDERESGIMWHLPVTMADLEAAGVELDAAPADGQALLRFGIDCDPYDAERDDPCQSVITVRDGIGEIARFYTADPGKAGITARGPRIRNEQRMWAIARARVSDLDQALDAALADYQAAYQGED